MQYGCRIRNQSVGYELRAVLLHANEKLVKRRLSAVLPQQLELKGFRNDFLEDEELGVSTKSQEKRQKCTKLNILKKTLKFTETFTRVAKFCQVKTSAYA